MRKWSMLMCAGLAVLLCACSGGTSQGSENSSSNVLKEECLDDIQAGLQARFEVTDSDANSVAESQKQLKDAINEELSYVEKYTQDSFDSDESFDDEQFENTVLAYIEALENQKRGVKYWRSNATKYERLYNRKGYDAWSKALNSLVDQYGLTVDSQYQDDLDNVLSDNRYQNIRIGDTVDVSTENGDISVSIEGMEWTDWKELAQEDGDFEIAVLKCTIKNIDYSDEYNVDFVSMGNILNVSDMHYYIQNPWDSSYDTYGVYKGAAGAFPQIPVGQKKRVAIPYCITTNVSKVRIVIGSKYELFLKING